MMDNCEASNARILESLNTTLDTLNTTGLSKQHVEWLKDNTTNNITSGLQKCDLETFLTDVRVDVDPPVGGLLPEKVGRGVLPAYQNPYPIYDLTKNSKSYL